MSFTEVFAVRDNGDVTKYGEAHNSFGGAFHIWRSLKEKYNVVYASLMDFSPLWELAGSLEEADNWVLASTFDRVVVAKEQLPILITHLKTFVEIYPSPTLLEEIAILEKAIVDESIQGIAFNQTSVNADTWLTPLSLKERRKTGEYTRAYNINTDTGHWFLTSEKFDG